MYYKAMSKVGQGHTHTYIYIYINHTQCLYGGISRRITMHTVMYGAWCIHTVMAIPNPKP